MTATKVKYRIRKSFAEGVKINLFFHIFNKTFIEKWSKIYLLFFLNFVFDKTLNLLKWKLPI